MNFSLFVVVGMWSRLTKRSSRKFRLSNRGRGVGRRTKGAFFDQLAPQYVTRDADRMTVGLEAFRSRGFQTVATADGRFKSVSIAETSKLLDGVSNDSASANKDTDPYQRIQAQGADDLKKLTRAIDDVVLFSHPKWDDLMVRLAGYGPQIIANQRLREASQAGDQSAVDCTRYQQLFREAPRVHQAAVGYLKCIQEDEKNLLEQLKAALQQQASVAELDGRRIDALCSALAELKNRLRSGPTIGSWPGHPLDELSKRPRFQWLRDLRANGAIGHEAGSNGGDHGESARVIDGSSPEPVLNELIQQSGNDRPALDIAKPGFVDVYRHFLNVEETVQRTIRTGEYHPRMAALLFSKYREHGQDDFAMAAADIWKTSIRGRTPPVSMEDRKFARRCIEKAFAQRGVDVALQRDKNFPAYRTAVMECVSAVTHIETALTRGHIKEWYRRKRIELLGTVGGSAGLLVRNAETHSRDFKPLYRQLYAAMADGQAFDKEVLREKMLEVCLSPEHSAFVNGLFDGLPADASRELVVETFMNQLVDSADEPFQTSYVAQLATIGGEAARDDALVFLHLHQGVASEGDRCGVPHYITPAMLAAVEVPDPDLPVAQEKALLASAEQALSDIVPEKLTTTLPESLYNLPTGVRLNVVHDGTTIAHVERQDDQITIEICAAATASFIASRASTIQLADGQPFIDANGQPGSLFVVRGVECFDPMRLDRTSLIEVVKGYDRLSAMQAKAVARFASSDDSEVTHQIRRALRFSAVLERLMAAPASAVPLKVPDLGQPLGLLLAFFENADMRDPDLFESRPSERTSACLAKTDLSVIYPAENAKALAKFMQYTYAQCENVDKIAPLIAEIGQQCDQLQSAPPDVDFLYINDTLEGCNSDPTTDNLFYALEQPRVAYVTQQAFADPARPAAELNLFARRLIESLAHTDERVPIFCADTVISNDQTPLPVVDPRTFPLPKIKVGRKGYNAATDELIVDRPTAPYLGLAVSLVAPGGDDCNIARPTRDQAPPNRQGEEDKSEVFADIPDDLVRREWPKKLNVAPRSGQPISELYREAWFAPPISGNNCLLPLVVSTVAFNLAQKMARRERQDLCSNFSRMLKLALDDAQLVASETQGLDPRVLPSLHSIQCRRRGGKGGWLKLSGEPIGPTLNDDYQATYQNRAFEVSLRWWKQAYDILSRAPDAAGNVAAQQSDAP